MWISLAAAWGVTPNTPPGGQVTVFDHSNYYVLLWWISYLFSFVVSIWHLLQMEAVFKRFHNYFAHTTAFFLSLLSLEIRKTLNQLFFCFKAANNIRDGLPGSGSYKIIFVNESLIFSHEYLCLRDSNTRILLAVLTYTAQLAQA